MGLSLNVVIWIKQNCLDCENICCWKTGQWPCRPCSRFTACKKSVEAHRTPIPWMCECTSCPSPLFLAASCSDPEVCSISFLHCTNRAQASSVSSSFMTFTQPIDVYFASAFIRCVRVVRVHGIVVKSSRAWKNCSKSFDSVSTRESLCVPKHCLTPLRSETDKRGHEEIFPHDDVTAWEKKGLSDSSFCLESDCLLFPFWSVILGYASLLNGLWIAWKLVLKVKSLRWTVIGVWCLAQGFNVIRFDQPVNTLHCFVSG